MRTISVNDIKQMEDGENITSIQGTLTKLYPVANGGEEDKKWSRQNGLFKDQTGEMRVVAWNHHDLTIFLNKQVTISSHKGEKGLSGVYVEDSSWKDKTTGEQKSARQIKLTATAQIAPVNGSQKAALVGTIDTEVGPQSDAQREPTDSVNSYRHALMRIINSIYLNYKAIQGEGCLSDQLKIDGIILTPDQIQAAAASAFIALNQQGLVQSLPDRPLWGAKEQLKKVDEPVGEDEW